MQGILLGLSTGTVCLAYCAPVLVPYMLGEGGKTGRNFYLLVQFLLGRLLGYLLFGIFAWLAGKLLINTAELKDPIVGTAYLILALALAVYGMLNEKKLCMMSVFNKFKLSGVKRNGYLPAALFGLLTGINLCPPFLLAFTGASDSGGMLQSMFFFFTFFIGTSLFFLPVPFIGLIKFNERLKDIGKMACLLVSIYYLYTGIVMLTEGVKNL